MPAAVRSTCPSGTTMPRTKYSPDMTVNSRIATAMNTLTMTAFLTCRSTSARLVTSRRAATSSAS